MKSTYCEYILEKILSTSEVGLILALIAPSPFISLLSVDIEWHGRNESCWPKWPENINWPSGPIFVQFDWPDRKYTGHGPAVTSTPAMSTRDSSIMPLVQITMVCSFSYSFVIKTSLMTKSCVDGHLVFHTVWVQSCLFFLRKKKLLFTFPIGSDCKNEVLHWWPSWISDMRKKCQLFQTPSNGYSLIVRI